MLKAVYHKKFRKSLKKLPKNIRECFADKLLLFLAQPNHPSLKDHHLKGNLLGRRSFYVAGDVRVTYSFLSENVAILLDIGSHSKVY